MPRFASLARWLHGQRPAVLILILFALLATIGTAAYFVSRQVRAEYNLRIAGRELGIGHLSEAMARLDEVLHAWPESGEVHLLAARTARRMGAYDVADQHLKQYRRLGGVPEAIDLEHALALAQRGELRDVEANLFAFVENGHPESALILEALAQGFVRSYALPKAMRCIDRWLERQPDAVQALILRGSLYRMLNRSADAQRDYEKALQADPTNDDARLALAELLLAAHQTPAAAEHYRVLHEHQPDNARVLLGLAHCALDANQPARARELLQQLLRHEPDHAEGLRESGRIELETGEAQAAEPLLRRAVQLAPWDVEALQLFYRCLQQVGKAEEGQTCLARLERLQAEMDRLQEVKRLIAKSPRDAALRSEAGQILLRNGQEREGLRWLESALQEDPQHAPSHETLANYFEKTGKIDLAAAHRRR